MWRSAHGPDTMVPRSSAERPDEAAAPGRGSAVTSGNDSGGGPRTVRRPSSGAWPGAETAPAAKKPRSFWKELPILIGIALVLALLIKTFLVQAFSIPSDSMQNTLQRGDRVLVDKLTPWFGSEPERGEVVVFHDPDNWLAGEPTANPNAGADGPQLDRPDAVRRGEGPDQAGHRRRRRHRRVQGHRPADGQRQGAERGVVRLPGQHPVQPDDEGGQFKVKVPKGKIWVMGDHRQNSRDSRYNQTDKHKGMVPVDDVVGRAIVRAWPINRWGTLPVPDTFDQTGLNARVAAAGSRPPAGRARRRGAPLVAVARAGSR